MMQQDGEMLRLLSDNLQDDPEVVLTAIRSGGGAVFQYASPRLQRNRAFILRAIAEIGLVFRNASDDQRNDQNFVFGMLQASSLMLDCVPEELRRDSIFISMVARASASLFEHASAELQGNREFVLKLIKENGFVFRYASDALRGDLEFTLLVMQENGIVLEYASLELQDHPRVVAAAVRSNRHSFEHASLRLRCDRLFVLRLLAQNGLLLEHVARELQDDDDVVDTALRTSHTAALRYASARIQRERGFIATEQVAGLLAVSRDDVKLNPLCYLAGITAGPHRVRIHFLGESGVDIGGLTREFVTLLMSSLAHSQDLPKISSTEGLIPCVIANAPNVVSEREQIEAYRSIGILFGRALREQDGIVLGHHFHPVLFSMLHAVTEAELGRVSTDLPMDDPICQKLIGIFVRENLWVPSIGAIPDTTQAQIRALAAIAGFTEAEFIASYIMPPLRAVLAVATGIHANLSPGGGVWDAYKGATPAILRDKVEGKIDRDQLKNAFRCTGCSDEEQQQVKVFFDRWVDDSSDADLCGLIRVTTGAEGILPDMTIMFRLCPPSRNPFVAFHTCDRSIDINVVDTYESFRNKLTHSVQEGLLGGGGFGFV
jgi:hypothetical protein